MKRQLLIAFLAASSLVAFAKNEKKQNVLDLKHSITDNSIVYPESFENDTRKIQESWFLKNYTATDTRYETEPDAEVSDAEMTKRLNALPTVIEMPYNQVVRSYIDRYTKKGRAQVASLLGLSLYYMPIFEQALEEQGLPLELKYLPLIESGLNPNAVSKHGAAGLWQFMLGTAKGLGMEVNSLVDERRDPYVASERAVSYLKDLYSAYGDWSLAIAAYNCGPGTVNKAIRRAGGDPKSHDFWSIYSYLPEETRGYVPMFIAANYVMNYYPKHNISPVLPVKPLVMDTIQVGERIHFNQISKVIDIPVEELRILNPQFRADVIPGTPESPYTLILPSQQIHAYLMSENDIRNFEAEKYSKRGVVEPGDAPADAMAAVEDTPIWPEDNNEAEETLAAAKSRNGNKSLVVHKVVAGETLSSIADRYGVTVAEIKRSNNLRRNAVRVGQQLRISSGTPQAVMENTVATVTGKNQQSARSARQQKEANAQQQKQTKQKAQSKPAAPATHKLKNGDTLSSLSKKYGVSVAELKKANGMTNDNLRAGETIKIPVKGGAASVKSSSKGGRKASASKSSSKKSSSKGSSKSSSKKKRR
ncbi:MAG: LysM peptidoglycan-binding domain-containing protein [Muribaculaceae bacterium]|nr:LysM peptidoglycan-binding domain-containing protein [Muribaculaceae bacterium]MDE6755322.1 LysM peptidoglycan-binding domain-containing protein [Muribaculaceae bacterium]